MLAIAHKRLIKNEDRHEKYRSYALSIFDVMKILTILVWRGPRLYKKLKPLHSQAIDSFFSDFCSVYSYLVYFHRLFLERKPKFAITSNDHNGPNRCMLAVAHYLEVETVYLQHASVSNLFPALRVSYAFLDGQHALETYRYCENNQPTTNRKVPIPTIFLSGQKKKISVSQTKNTSVVGVALNLLDDISDAINLIESLTNTGLFVRLRWHPRLPKSTVNKYFAAFNNNLNVSLSNQEKPKRFLIFFLKLDCSYCCVVDSIHLEAALAADQASLL